MFKHLYANSNENKKKNVFQMEEIIKSSFERNKNIHLHFIQLMAMAMTMVMANGMPYSSRNEVKETLIREVHTYDGGTGMSMCSKVICKTRSKTKLGK